MERIVTQSTVGGDGMLVVSLGPELAGRTVQVTVEPAPGVRKAADMTQEEWQAFIQLTSGSIPDPTFIRHGQGEFQEREPLG